MVKRANSWQDAYNTGTALLDLGDGIRSPLPIDGVLPGTPGPPGAGVPAGGAAKQLIRMNTAGTVTEWVSPDRALVGLNNVDNTADTEKPISTATQTALDGKASASALAALNAGVVIAAEPSGGDDTAALNALIASGAGKTVQLKAGRVYKITDTLVIPSGTIFDLNGASIDATGIPVGTALGQRIALSATGSLGASLPITTAIPQWSRTVAGISDTTGLAAGDLVLISNNERPVPGMTRTDRNKGQLALIRSVDSATQITLMQGAMLAYGTTSLIVRKVAPVRDITVKNGSITMGGIESAHNGFYVRYGRNVTTDVVRIDGAEDSGISYLTVWNGRIRSSSIKGSTSSTTLGLTGYGVAITEGSAHITVDDNRFENCRHWVAGGGQWPAVFVDVNHNHGINSVAAGFECHESTFYWKFFKNTATGCDTAFLVRGQYVTIEENETNESSANSILVTTYDLVTEQRGIRLINNTDHKSAFGIKVDGQTGIDQPDSVKINLEIRGNKVNTTGGIGIMVRHFDGASIEGNTVDGTLLEGVRIIGLSGTRSKNLALGLNSIRNTTAVGLRLENVDGIESSEDRVLNSGNYGVQADNCTDTAWATLAVRTPALSGVYLNGGSSHSFTGPKISGVVSASYDGIRVAGATDLSVVGGKISGARWAIYSTTTDYVLISGVNMRGVTQGARYSVDATNKTILAGSNMI